MPNVWPTIKIEIDKQHFVVQARTQEMNVCYDSDMHPEKTGVMIFIIEWSNLLCNFLAYVYNSDNNNLTEKILKELSLTYTKVKDSESSFEVDIDPYVKLVRKMEALHRLEGGR